MGEMTAGPRKDGPNNEILANHADIIPTILSQYNITAEQVERFLSGQNVTEKVQMCSDLDGFTNSYSEVHGWIALVICIFGAVANLLNIIVLTRKDMNGSPINRILTGMAVADITLILDYLPFVVHIDLWPSNDIEEQFSWGWSAYLWFHVNFSIVIHNVSIWLTLTVAVWRFIMIRYHTLVPVYCTMTRCHLLLLSAYVGPVILTIPQYITFTIKSLLVVQEENRSFLGLDTANYTGEEEWVARNITKYYIHFSDLAEERNGLLFRLTLWVYSFILKLVPSIILTVITGFLIQALYKAEERSARLKTGRGIQHTQVTTANGNNQGQTATPVTATAAATTAAGGDADNNGTATTGIQTNNVRVAVNNNGSVIATALKNAGKARRKSIKPSSRKRSTDRTTRLLIVILVLFLLTEFPQAILGMLSAFNLDFFKHCYTPLGTTMDDIALLNSSINFIIYYFMSKQFRKTFHETFGLTWCKCPTSFSRNHSINSRQYTEMKPITAMRKMDARLVEEQHHTGRRSTSPPQHPQQQQVHSNSPPASTPLPAPAPSSQPLLTSPLEEKTFENPSQNVEGIQIFSRTADTEENAV